MYSFVIKITILVNRAVLLDITTPAPVLTNPNVELPTADPAPTSLSRMINNTFF